MSTETPLKNQERRREEIGWLHSIMSQICIFDFNYSYSIYISTTKQWKMMCLIFELYKRRKMNYKVSDSILNFSYTQKKHLKSFLLPLEFRSISEMRLFPFLATMTQICKQSYSDFPLFTIPKYTSRPFNCSNNLD